MKRIFIAFVAILGFNSVQAQVSCDGTIDATAMATWGAVTTIGNGTTGSIQICLDANSLSTNKCQGLAERVIILDNAGNILYQWFPNTTVGTCITLTTTDGYAQVSHVCSGGDATISWTTLNPDGSNACVPCTSDANCPGATVCVNGVCVDQPCTVDGDCPSGYECGDDGTCVSSCDFTGTTLSVNDVITNSEIISECGTAFNACSYGAAGNTNCIGQTGQGNTPFYNDLDCNASTQTGGGSDGADVGYSIENDIFYQMCPQTTGNWEIEITGFNCVSSTGGATTNGYQVSVFSGATDGSALNTLLFGGASGQNLSGTTTITVDVTDLSECVFIAIDGFAGTQCEFEISVQPLDGQDCIIIDPTAGAIGVNDTICSGETASPTAYTNDVGSSVIFSWYSTELSGAVLATGATYTTPPLTSNTSYWVEVNVDGTVSPRVEVFVIVNPLPVLAPVTNPEVCADAATIDLDALAPAETAGVSGSGQWYTGADNTGGPVSGVQNVTDGVQFFYEYTSTLGGCVDEVAITVTVLPQIIPNFTVGGTFCQNSNSVNFTNTSNSGSLNSPTYAWSFPSGTPSTSTATSPSGVTWTVADTYNITLTVTDGACTGEITLPITINPTPTITVIGINPTCAGGTGTISALGDPAGGGYVWDNAPNSAGPHSVTAGTYEVTYTTTDGCTIVDDVALTEPTPLTGSVTSQTNVLCNGAATGSATIAGAGGTAPYQFDIGGAQQAAGDFTGLTATTYTATVEDANGCTSTIPLVIGEPAPLAGNLDGTAPASCNGVADGTATVSATGGTTPYTFNIGTGNQATGDFNGLADGNYTVTITDANNCITTVGLTITEPAAIVASIAIQADADCNGTATGSATIAGAGGTAPYQFDIGGAQQATGDFTGLTATTYTATVEDANGCISTIPLVIGEPLVLAGNLDGTAAASCNGVLDGEATVSATGGTTPYTFNIGTGDQATGDFTGLADGDYTVTITDANDCVTTVDLTITEPVVLAGNLDGTAPASCNGVADGTATVSATGGTTPYTFNIGTGDQATGDFTGLADGDYTVTITDANDCVTTVDLTITEPAVLAGNLDGTTPASCNGVLDGEVTVSATGGTTPYTFNIGTGNQATGDFNGLADGNYTVTITDANNCITTVGLTITEPAAIVASIAIQADADCNGTATGSATIAGAGGTAPYQFDIGGAQQATGDFTGLTATTYTATVEDANGCISTIPLVIGEPAPLAGTLDGAIPASCNGVLDGEATVSATGGTTPYTFNIGTGDQATGDFTGLADGDYTVTITDANDCVTTVDLTITEPAVLAGNLDGTAPASCNGVADGTATVSATGGTTPYTFNIGTGDQATGDFTGLADGDYTVTITDANDCVTTVDLTITEPAVLAGNLDGTTPASCNGVLDGEVTVSATGGTTPYTFNIGTGNQATGDFNGLADGNYTVTITDANNCITTVGLTITEPAAIVASIAIQADADCNGTATGSATIAGAGGTAPYQFDIGGAQQATGDFTGLTATTYTATVEDANGCISTIPLVIGEPAPLAGTLDGAIPASCNGVLDGEATVSATGGTTPYTFNIGTGDQATGDFTGLADGDYTVTITDANDCVTTVDLTITEPVVLAGNLDGTAPASCNGVADGTATVSATGGTTPYTFNIGTGDQATGDFTGLADGDYTVTITDANDCVTTVDLTITEPAVLAGNLDGTTPASCNGVLDGEVTVSATGGTTPYTFNIGTGNQATGDFNGLADGNYTVTITDANNCITTVGLTITEPAAIVASYCNTS